MNDSDFQNKLKQSLSQKSKLSAKSEDALFTQAERLLSTRRQNLASREAEVARSAQARAHVLLKLKAWIARSFEIFAIHPDAPAAVMTFAALVLAFLALHTNHGRALGPASISMDSLVPDFPKNNDAPARYDAQRVAEQMAYEREVEDAHRKTSGGI